MGANRRSRGCGRVGLCSWPRLSQGHAQPLAAVGRSHRSRDWRVRVSRIYGFRARFWRSSWRRRAGNGWRGKHTLLLESDAGSLFFIGEILVDIPLPPDALSNPDQRARTRRRALRKLYTVHRCLPDRGRSLRPYRVDARRCISYLTIELKGSIPEEMRPLIGNRVYGCDDCQLVCPWNKFAQAAPVADFDVRHGLDRASLVMLFGWSAHDFDERMQGSAIRRIGHERWLRNIAVAMGNALRSPALGADERLAIRNALNARATDDSELVREHVEWALRQEA